MAIRDSFAAKRQVPTEASRLQFPLQSTQREFSRISPYTTRLAKMTRECVGRDANDLPIGSSACFGYDRAETSPKLHPSSRTNSWKLQPGTGHTTLGCTSPELDTR